MATIRVDKKKCIGCGSCVSLCENFELNNGKAIPKKPKVDKITCEKRAAEACPTEAISVKE